MTSNRRFIVVDPVELEHHYQLALKEVGLITPWWREETQAWIFSSPYYDMEGEGTSEQDCIDTYRRWLRTFVEERLKDNLAADLEANSPGRGGRREGAGRPKGSVKDGAPKTTVYVLSDLADLLRGDEATQRRALAWLRQTG